MRHRFPLYGTNDCGLTSSRKANWSQGQGAKSLGQMSLAALCVERQIGSRTAERMWFQRLRNWLWITRGKEAEESGTTFARQVRARMADRDYLV